MDRTPISVLQDFCTRHLDGATPEYQLLSVEGVVHAPTFIYRVQVSDMVATATGQSKKKAKHAAALAALESLAGKYEDAPGLEFVQSMASPFVGEPQPEQPLEETGTSNECNPVGKLQEVCMKKRWRPPNYETVEELGLPHERVFTMSCEIEHIDLKIKVQGTGRSKKLAKRNAAQEMIAILEEKDLYDPNQITQNGTTQEKVAKQVQNENFVYDSTSGLSAKEKIEDFLKNLGEELNEELNQILPASAEDVEDEDERVEGDEADEAIGGQKENEDYCQMLETVAEYTMCKIKYLNTPALEDKEKLYLVHLIPGDSLPPEIPVVTGWGSGTTTETAKRRAAKKALLLFKQIRFMA